MKSLIVFVWLYTSLWNACHAEDSMQEVSQSSLEFTKSFYTALTKSARASDSMLFSPVSVQTILAMCYMGAGGETAKQMAKGLRLPDNPNLIKSGYQQLFKSLLSSSGRYVTFETANGIFLADKYSVLKTYTDMAKEFFSTTVESVTFGDGSVAASTINRWVKKKTHGEISDIVRAEEFDIQTDMILINAVYFKGRWENPFDKERTSKAPFFVDGKHKKQVDTMHLTNYFLYQKNEEIGAKLLELPYMESSTSLVIVLPLKLDGLQSVERKLQKVDLMELFGTLKLKEVQLSLPRFSLQASYTLKSVLKGLGMVEMFNAGGNPDFSKLKVKSEDAMSVANVLHKATIDVNEEGTLATGVTRATQVYADSASSGRPEKVECVVDHPFVFALISKKARSILFVGRYTGVKAKGVGRGHESGASVRSKGQDRSSGSSSPLVDDCLRWWLPFVVFSLRL